MKNLKQKLATGIVWLGGLAGLAGMAGCESPEGNMGLATLGNMAQVSPYATADDRMLGAGLSTIGQMGHNMNTAKAGRSQVNVNVNNNFTEPKDYSDIDYSIFNRLINLENRKSEIYYGEHRGRMLEHFFQLGESLSPLGYKLIQRKDYETKITWLKPVIGENGKVWNYSYEEWSSAPEYIRNLKIDE